MLSPYYTILFSYLSFVLIPVYVIIFFVRYVMSYKKVRDKEFLLPLMVVLTQMGFLLFYLLFSDIFGVEKIRVFFAWANMILAVYIHFLKYKNRQRLYLIPLFLAFVWFIAYIY